MRQLTGALRCVLAILALTARLLLRAFNVRVEWIDASVFRRHHGFVFPNHISYLDALVIDSLIPMRFVAKAEIRRWPMVGYIARAAGCVFVQRDQKESRTQARASLARMGRYPPIVLFPEGGTGPPGRIRPFRYGAFEIAVDGGIPFLPCIIDYGAHAGQVYWDDRTLMGAAWQLLTHAEGPIIARVVPLRGIEPQPGDDPKRMAIAIHGAMNALLTSQRDEQQIIEPGL